MRILFFVKKSRLRRFVDVVRLLAEEGHEIVLLEAAAPEAAQKKPSKVPKQLADVPGISWGHYAAGSDSRRAEGLDLLRATRNYLWFFSGPQAASAFHRQRYAGRLSKHMAFRSMSAGAAPDASKPPPWPDPIEYAKPQAIARLQTSLAALEEAIPADPAISALVRSHRPDLVLVTPLMLFEAPQTDVVKAARALGVPCGFLVYSWDNLTNKGALQVMPDRLFVWNEVQRREATELHGVSPEQVVATGAPRLDGFFAMQPSRSRDVFCSEYGLDPQRPIVLYVASSATVSENEPAIADRWIEAVESAADPAVRDANILVRTYPPSRRLDVWESWTPRSPRVGVDHAHTAGYQGLYDDIHHAAVVVGLNTSAQIEAAALATPVLAFAGGSSAPGQEQTLNFHYMLRENGGHVEFAASLDEHVGQLARCLAGDYDPEAIRRFAREFLRPHGLDRPVAPILAAEIAAMVKPRSLRWRAEDFIESTTSALRRAVPHAHRGMRRVGSRTLARVSELLSASS